MIETLLLIAFVVVVLVSAFFSLRPKRPKCCPKCGSEAECCPKCHEATLQIHKEKK
jgi:hypothetical protein